MTDVFVLTYGVGYEIENIIGVYGSLELAEFMLAAWEKMDRFCTHAAIYRMKLNADPSTELLEPTVFKDYTKKVKE